MRQATMDKVAIFGVILGSGLLLCSFAAMSLSAIGLSASVIGISLVVKRVVRDLNQPFKDQNTSVEMTPLCQAIAKGEWVKSRVLLALGADPNQIVGGVDTPALYYALTSPYNRILIPALIRAGANPNSAAFPFKSLVYRAATLGNIAAVEALVKGGATVDAHEEDGATALFAAIENTNLELVQKLLELGADKTLTKGRQTPLQFAQSVEEHLSPGDNKIKVMQQIRALLAGD